MQILLVFSKGGHEQTRLLLDTSTEAEALVTDARFGRAGTPVNTQLLDDLIAGGADGARSEDDVWAKVEQADRFGYTEVQVQWYDKIYDMWVDVNHQRGFKPDSYGPEDE